jgi:hypothetical protein
MNRIGQLLTPGKIADGATQKSSPRYTHQPRLPDAAAKGKIGSLTKENCFLK